ncbi:hypothetical protein GRX01_17805 [Halobaculum sp. WSA2]|uniref:Uncharacterized protein n=1 Tax=Halobaculum saliterrae TaxID=2073113 RepID=A0A6B0T0N2_9EURY|nr:hypothetical protein [Halobaculum saliterrae]MXR43186.1 hypothetical protein [Halobaculum saliterrae]
MAGDVRNPLGDLKGYQFWAVVGILTIIVPRILLAYDIPLGIFTLHLWENPQATILLNDALGFLITLSAYFTYKDFVNASSA